MKHPFNKWPHDVLLSLHSSFAGFSLILGENSKLLQITTSQVTDEKRRHGKTEGSAESYDCSNQARLKRMRETCEENNMDQYEYRTYNNTLFLIVVDDERKLLYCQIGKSASSSFLEYFTKTTGKIKGEERIRVHTKKGLRSIGLDMIFNVSWLEVNTKYRDYTKIVVVRHPLQRLVSAYFHIFQNRNRSETLGSLTMDEFLANVTGKLLDANNHWSRFHNQCKLCFIKYDYVIQTETIDADIVGAADILGVPPNHTSDKLKSVLEQRNPNKNNQYRDGGMFRYDDILERFQSNYPSSMDRLLHLYREDMELFDYGWDRDRKKSVCRRSINSRQCCA